MAEVTKTKGTTRSSPSKNIPGKTVPSVAVSQASPAVPSASANDVPSNVVIHCKHLSNRQNFVRMYYNVIRSLFNPTTLVNV